MSHDCTRCGACCSVNFTVEVEAEEQDDLFDAIDESVLIDLDGADFDQSYPEIMGVPKRDGRCVALIGDVGTEVFCAVYEARPKTCSTFTPGSTQCEDVRAVWFADPYRDPIPNLVQNALVSIRLARPERAAFLDGVFRGAVPGRSWIPCDRDAPGSGDAPSTSANDS